MNVHLKTAAHSGINIPAKAALAAPIQRESSSASSFAFAAIKSANLFMQTARWAPVNVLHGPVLKAAWAAVTAILMSSSPATSTAAGMVDPSEGLMSVRVSDDFAPTYYISQEMYDDLGQDSHLVVYEKLGLECSCHFYRDSVLHCLISEAAVKWYLSLGAGIEIWLHNASATPPRASAQTLVLSFSFWRCIELEYRACTSSRSQNSPFRVSGSCCRRLTLSNHQASEVLLGNNIIGACVYRKLDLFQEICSRWVEMRQHWEL